MCGCVCVCVCVSECVCVCVCVCTCLRVQYHVYADPIPRRVPVVLHESGPLDEHVLKQLAEDLGPEWQHLASRLNVHHVRIQAILR